MTEKRIGIIYPADGVLDREFWKFAPPHVSLHLTRAIVPDAPITLDLVTRLVDDPWIVRAAETFYLIRPAAIAYACTSVSFARGRDGEQSILRRISAAANAPATTTSTALVAACSALALRRVLLITPYIPAISAQLVKFLAASGVTVVVAKDLNLVGGIGDVPAQAVATLVGESDRIDAEGVLIACTNLATAEVIVPLERQLGRPVITANQATVWHACQLAGIGAGPGGGIGRLWSESLKVGHS